MNPIYQPTGRAGEYGDYAINIYTGCNHGCAYCYAAMRAKRWGKDFTRVVPRNGIVEATKRQLMREGITGKLIHLCFTCDPYPADVDTTVTREIIKAIKESDNHVQILTKGGDRAQRDLDLLDSGDWFGVTYTGGLNGVDCTNDYEPNAAPDNERFLVLADAFSAGIKTWLSCEPVLEETGIFGAIRRNDLVHKFKIGKLNYHTPEDFGLPPIDWKAFGQEAERLCRLHGRDYLIKKDLRREMVK